MSFNKVILMGNLVRDPEFRPFQNGGGVAKFTVATSRKFKSADGQEKEETAFVDVEAFGKQGEVIDKFFHKGKPILVEGRLRLNEWATETGDKRSKLLVHMENFEFIGKKDDAGQKSEPSDDIPF